MIFQIMKIILPFILIGLLLYGLNKGCDYKTPILNKTCKAENIFITIMLSAFVLVGILIYKKIKRTEEDKW